ncbi:hypothetical protein HDV00_001705, partial [Rhizophlyctis rosea]
PPSANLAPRQASLKPTCNQCISRWQSCLPSQIPELCLLSEFDSLDPLVGPTILDDCLSCGFNLATGTFDSGTSTTLPPLTQSEISYCARCPAWGECLDRDNDKWKLSKRQRNNGLEMCDWVVEDCARTCRFLADPVPCSGCHQQFQRCSNLGPDWVCEAGLWECQMRCVEGDVRTIQGKVAAGGNGVAPVGLAPAGTE